MYFDKTRQLSAENAHQEMFITDNGPVLVRADGLLKRACDKYWKVKTKEGKRHYVHRDEARSYADSSLTVRRHKKEKSRLAFNSGINYTLYSLLVLYVCQSQIKHNTG